MTVAKKLGRRVRELREGLGMTQLDISALTGIKRPNVSRIERGRTLPRLDTLVVIANALRVKPTDILDVLDPRDEGADHFDSMFAEQPAIVHGPHGGVCPACNGTRVQGVRKACDWCAGRGVTLRAIDGGKR